MAKRIQRQRTKGWRMPEGAVYVGRPTKWGNPYTMEEMTGVRPQFRRRAVVDAFGDEFHWLKGGPEVEALRGKDLVCWCRLDQPCHADVLLEWANG